MGPHTYEVYEMVINMMHVIYEMHVRGLAISLLKERKKYFDTFFQPFSYQKSFCEWLVNNFYRR